MNKSIDFNLKDKDDKIYSLKDFNQKYKIIYFYPKDNTPGCTIESKEFSDLKQDFAKNDAIVIGISGGDNKSKEKFCTTHKIKILLLSDTDFSISKSYGVYGEKKFMGGKYMGIKRTTFILDKNNCIMKQYDNVTPLGHAKEVLHFIRGLA